MQIAILDDSTIDQEQLRSYVNRYLEEKGLRAEISLFNKSEDLLKECNAFTIVFLDIFVGAENGMQVAKALREAKYSGNIIFVTISKDFAIEGYVVQACGYLVKPFRYEDLCKIMATIEKELTCRKDFIEIKEGRVMVKLRLKDILYSDYYNHYIQIHTKQHLYRTYLSFADFAEMLSPYRNFLSCYRNVIVNLEYVASMDTKDFVMKDGCRIPIAKIKRQEVRQAYADYLFTLLSEKK